MTHTGDNLSHNFQAYFLMIRFSHDCYAIDRGATSVIVVPCCFSDGGITLVLRILSPMLIKMYQQGAELIVSHRRF